MHGCPWLLDKPPGTPTADEAGPAAEAEGADSAVGGAPGAGKLAATQSGARSLPDFAQHEAKNVGLCEEAFLGKRDALCL
jgi:hypothetical protein